MITTMQQKEQQEKRNANMTRSVVVMEQQTPNTNAVVEKVANTVLSLDNVSYFTRNYASYSYLLRTAHNSLFRNHRVIVDASLVAR